MLFEKLFGKDNEGPLVIAGPCVIETEDIVFETAKRLKEICRDLSLPFIFKSSYDKANRTSINSYRGPGIDRGLRILEEVKNRFSIPVLTDIHYHGEADVVSEVVDVIQIPAFLCRQTDIVRAAADTGTPVNIKKGQFMAPWDMRNVIEKARSSGNDQIMITERGATFGYNNLVVDFRALPIMRSFGCPVIFDVTHSVQLPGGQGTCSGGQSEFAAPLARAAAATGVDGLFMETHPEPGKALCDGPNMIKLDNLKEMLSIIKAIHVITKTGTSVPTGER